MELLRRWTKKPHCDRQVGESEPKRSANGIDTKDLPKEWVSSTVPCRCTPDDREQSSKGGE
eukprot:6180745-Amphidinium_carterae.1